MGKKARKRGKWGDEGVKDVQILKEEEMEGWRKSPRHPALSLAPCVLHKLAVTCSVQLLTVDKLFL